MMPVPGHSALDAPSKRRPERWRRALIDAAFIILAACAGAGLVAWARVRPVLECVAEKRAIERMLRSHQRATPGRTRDSGWNEALGCLLTAQGNVFFSLHRNTLEETRRFRQDIEPRFGPGTSPDLDDLRWCWDHMRASNDRARKYLDRFRPDFDWALERAVKEDREAGVKAVLP